MFKSILVPTDGSPMAEKTFGPAIEAAKTNNGSIVGISVAHPFVYPRPTEGTEIPNYKKKYEQDALRLPKQHVQRLAKEAQQQGLQCETTTPCSVDPAGEIVAAVERFGCNVIFIASHGRRCINKLLPGSETQRVLADSPAPVLVFR
ncbi:universal stress protein [Noviherbaspirillum sp. CPCC 100848]|uniref:Universal stress protein n=2 Tax=Noviherbaspirillum album TaxID=3080276 RepID=A0ABU6JIV2_9BURK|nr:universal stress protein [Noviherbaspirillum sp. CPCC 100848]